MICEEDSEGRLIKYPLIRFNVNYDLNGALEVAQNFVKELGYSTGSARVDLARYDEEAGQWHVHINLGIVTTKIRVVVIDDKTGDVISFDRPPLSLVG